MANRFKQAAEYQQSQINKKETEDKQEQNIKQENEIQEVEKGLNLKRILDNIENKELSSNYTFYLKKANVDKLRHIAKQKKISSSKLLDNILSELLSNEE